MSSRRSLSKTESTNPNPATVFLEWKSNDKCLAYYDKEKGEKIKVQLPLKFQFLEHFHVIKGFSDAEQTGIYSNEVMFTSKEPLTVKTYNGKTIAEGLYSEIRSKVRDAGGKYHKSIYAVNEAGEIINFQIKGSVVSAWSTFLDGDKKLGIEGHGGKIESHWIELNEFQELRKGATKYSVPVFEIGDAFSKEELTQADEAYQEIVNYFKKYQNKEEDLEPIKPETGESYEDDELGF